MEILENYSLKNYNTFGIDVKARFFVDLKDIDEITEFIENYLDPETRFLILGGGSNILFTDDFEGWIIHVASKGIENVREDDEHIYVRSAAGELWDDLVRYCLKNDYAGIENLSMIPGNVGAAPIQNIGAYGVELKEYFEELEAINLSTGRKEVFSINDCKFGYRDSVFKNELKGKYIIASLTLRLNKKPVFKTSYGAIKQELARLNVKEPTIQSISQAVRNIRSSKLPDPEILGNAGSFFKNPTVTKGKYDEIREIYPEIIAYPVNSGNYKLAAGWMIEQCGWKGKRTGDAGVHRNQALVLVNYGKASGKEIYGLSVKIQRSVLEKFNVTLEREVNVIE